MHRSSLNGEVEFLLRLLKKKKITNLGRRQRDTKRHSWCEKKFISIVA